MKYFPSKHLSKKYNNPEFKFNVCYNYDRSIKGKVINYKKNILYNDEDLGQVRCNCNLYSEYVDPNVGHVITGNVNIV